VHTAVWKDPVAGRCRVSRLNLEGDGQGDLAGHGGEQRAVFVYQIESYRYWQEQLKRTDFVHGQFGENFTIEGLPDDATCIGDRYQIGSALFEVTQPRVTCYRVGIRMNEPRMPALLTSSGRPGFYFRVLQEGVVGAGDEIVKVGEASERMTVAEINALLYLPNHKRDRLERALRIETLSPGWRSSFEALLQSRTTAAGSGNAGLAPSAAAHPAAPGFRPLRVTAIDQESADVLSLTMQSPDSQPLQTALPGQYLVLRLQPTGSALFRSYSLSGSLSTERYRISVKVEPNGAAGTYLREHVRVGDALDVSSPRGSFILLAGERPVVLLSAGIGATPVIAMLHVLAATRSTRQVLWLHGARDREHHVFASEVRQLMRALPHGRSFVCYSNPGASDKAGEDFDAFGRLRNEKPTRPAAHGDTRRRERDRPREELRPVQALASQRFASRAAVQVCIADLASVRDVPPPARRETHRCLHHHPQSAQLFRRPVQQPRAAEPRRWSVALLAAGFWSPDDQPTAGERAASFPRSPCRHGPRRNGSRAAMRSARRSSRFGASACASDRSRSTATTRPPPPTRSASQDEMEPLPQPTSSVRAPDPMPSCSI